MKRILALTWVVLIGMTGCCKHDGVPNDGALASELFSATEPRSAQNILTDAKSLLGNVKKNSNNLNDLFHDETTMTATEYAAFLLAFEECQFLKDDGFDKTTCRPLMSVGTSMFHKRSIHPQTKLTVLNQFLGSDDPRLRAAAYIQIDGTEPGDFFDMLFEKAQAESDPNAIIFAHGAIQSYITNNRDVTDEMCDFFENAALSNNWILRNMAAQTFGFKAVANQRPRLLTLLIDMYADEVREVRASAIRSSATYNDESVVTPLSNILNDENQAAIHSDAVDTLNRLWLDYPLYKNHSAAAYRAVLDYLRKPVTSASVNVPQVLALFSRINTENSAFKAWLENADYFKAQDLIDALQHIARDETLNAPAVSAARRAIHALGGNKALDDTISSLELRPSQDEIAIQDQPSHDPVH